MTVRPPASLRPPASGDTPASFLDYEIAQEKAASLGRLGRRLETTLAALRDFDSGPSPGTTRAALLHEAGDALWHFVVQREACGLRDFRWVVRDYGVPQEVIDRMGVVVRR